MNYYEKKLKEKKEYLYKKPKDRSQDTKKVKINKMKTIKKNAQLGMF